MKLHPYTETVLSSDYKEWRKHKGYLEDNGMSANTDLFNRLFQSIMKFKTTEFDEIADSRGNISKYPGMANMSEAINILNENSHTSSDVKRIVTDIKTVVDFLGNETELFVRAFSLNNTSIQLYYNSALYIVTDAISSLISTQIEILKSPTGVDIQVLDKLSGRPRAAFAIIKDLAASINKGETTRLLKTWEKQFSQRNLMGTTIITAGIVIAAGLAIIPLIRESLHLYYNARMSVSAYLEQQAKLVEINKNKQLPSLMTKAEAKKIADNQEKAIKRFYKLSDMIAIKIPEAEKKTTQSINEENNTWTVTEVVDSVQRSDRTGFAIF